MSVSLSRKTQKMIEERMKQAGLGTADELVQAALHALDELEPDEQTWAAIDRAEEQHRRGEGISVDEAFAKLRRKHLNS